MTQIEIKNPNALVLGQYRQLTELASDDAFICKLPRQAGQTMPDGVLAADDGHWLVAFSRRCTHMGCSLLGSATTPEVLPEPTNREGLLLCQCHSTCFDLLRQGQIVIGPATDWLPMLYLRRAQAQQDPAVFILEEAKWVEGGAVPYGVPFGKRRP